MKRNKQIGFTLIELLIAIVIFAIIALAAQSSFFNFSKSSKGIQNQIENIEELQQLTIFLDRDFSQVFGQKVTLDTTQFIVTSLQNDNLSDIYYYFENGNITRQEEGVDLVLISDVTNLKIRVLDNKNKWHTEWQKNNETYLKAMELKFNSVFGEIIKVVMLDE